MKLCFFANLALKWVKASWYILPKTVRQANFSIRTTAYGKLLLAVGSIYFIPFRTKMDGFVIEIPRRPKIVILNTF